MLILSAGDVEGAEVAGGAEVAVGAEGVWRPKTS